MKENSFVEGTLVASFALILIKILGAVYVIPFYSIIGESGGVLYTYAYSIYSLLLNVCTAGIPIAMSKIISEYNTLEMYDAKERALKLGNKIVGSISIVLFLAIFIFAKEAAYIFIGDLQGGSEINDVALVIRVISFCLLIIPFLAVKKGYLQGHKFITPTTNSQLIEQIVRIAIIIFGSYLAINVFNTEVSTGVAIALSGAFFGGVVAYLYLNKKIEKNIEKLSRTKDISKDDITDKSIVKKIATFALPLIIVSIAADIYSITDVALVIRGLSNIGFNAADAETISSIISTWGMKICLIVNAIATGLSISLIPHMVSSYVKKDTDAISRKFNQALGVIFIIAIPMSIGISILSKEVYTLFYGASSYGSIVLRFLPYAIFLSSIHMIMSMVLQSLNKFKTVYISTISGLVANAVLDIPLIYLFNELGLIPYYGAILATVVGYSLSIFIALYSLKKDIKLSYKETLLMLKKLIIPCLSMGVLVFILQYFLPLSFSGRIVQIPIIMFYGVVGAFVFFLLVKRNGLLLDVFGKEYIDNITNKIKRIFKRPRK